MARKAHWTSGMWAVALLLLAGVCVAAERQVVSEPPGAIADSVRTPAPEAKAKALLTLDQIVEQLPGPSYLGEEPSGKPQTPPLPPPEAVKAYIRGRADYLDNKINALDALEEARAHDPRSPGILRMLGIANFTFGNAIRGTLYLREALAINPNDTESLFLLGRAAIERREWQEAVVLLARSARSEDQDVDPAIRVLRPYYLGQVLIQQGYDAAAIEQLELFLESSNFSTRTTRLYMEVSRLDRHYGRILQEVGDALCRLGRYEQAAEHYKSADDDPYVDLDALTARKVYVYLTLGRVRDAEQSLLKRLRESQDSSSLLELVSYIASHGGDPEAFARQLGEFYAENERPPAVALAIADSLPTDPALKLLTDHLHHKPDDMTVFQGLVRRLMSDDSRRLMEHVEALIRTRPQQASPYMQQLLKHGVDPEELLNDLARLPDARKQTAAAHYIRGVLYMELQELQFDPEEREKMASVATQAFAQAIAAAPSFLTPQLATVELLTRLRHYDRALAFLDTLPNADDPQLRLARASVYSLTEKHEEAAAIIDGLLQSDPRNVEYRLALARAQHRAKAYEDAERTLWSVLDLDPINEAAFGHLFALYSDERNPRADATQRMRLLRRAQEAIPGSRITRIRTALFEAERGSFKQTEAILKQLLAEDPGDADALRLLAELYELDNRMQDAVTLLLDTAKLRPRDPAPSQLILRSLGRSPKLMEPYLNKIADELIVLPLTLPRLLLLTEIKNQQKKYDESLALFDKALEQLPANKAELYYYRSLVHHYRDDEAAAEADLIKALEARPDFDRVNNALGYMWADGGRHLDRALEMINKAVEADPSNVAYRDSLGWVYYKKGEFQLALEHLRRARNAEHGDDPVIVDHLGDALWRVGQKQEAIQQWRAAWEGLKKPDARDDAETRKTREGLAAKLKAVTDNTDPPVAPIGSPNP